MWHDIVWLFAVIGIWTALSIPVGIISGYLLYRLDDSAVHLPPPPAARPTTRRAAGLGRCSQPFHDDREAA